MLASSSTCSRRKSRSAQSCTRVTKVPRSYAPGIVSDQGDPGMSGRTRTRYPAAFSTSEGRSQLTMPDTSHLSSKDIPVDERLILALDVPSYDEAMALVDMLGDTVKFYKLGLELFVSGDSEPLRTRPTSAGCLPPSLGSHVSCVRLRLSRGLRRTGN